MKLFYCILFAFVVLHKPTQSQAQSTNDLDRIHGFKEFKLGDLKSKWASQITVEKVNPNSVVYSYNGPCCREAFGENLRGIFLSFNKQEKLESVYLIFRDNKHADGYQSFIKTIKQAFGEPTGMSMDDKNSETVRQWEGKNTTLNVMAIYQGVTAGGWHFRALVYSTEHSGSSADF